MISTDFLCPFFPQHYSLMHEQKFKLIVLILNKRFRGTLNVLSLLTTLKLNAYGSIFFFK